MTPRTTIFVSDSVRDVSRLPLNKNYSLVEKYTQKLVYSKLDFKTYEREFEKQEFRKSIISYSVDEKKLYFPQSISFNLRNLRTNHTLEGFIFPAYDFSCSFKVPEFALWTRIKVIEEIQQYILAKERTGEKQSFENGVTLPIIDFDLENDSELFITRRKSNTPFRILVR